MADHSSIREVDDELAPTLPHDGLRRQFSGFSGGIMAQLASVAIVHNPVIEIIVGGNVKRDRCHRRELFLTVRTIRYQLSQPRLHVSSCVRSGFHHPSLIWPRSHAFNAFTAQIGPALQTSPTCLTKLETLGFR